MFDRAADSDHKHTNARRLKMLAFVTYIMIASCTVNKNRENRTNKSGKKKNVRNSDELIITYKRRNASQLDALLVENEPFSRDKMLSLRILFPTFQVA